MKKVKKFKRTKRFFTAAVIIFMSLLVLGFLYESISEYVDSKTLVPPGKMVEVNGHKMHIYCTGQNRDGEPTVILEAGGGQTYTTWSKVQPEISRYTKVCSYDRSGFGFSEPTDDQRTNDEIVGELEILLKNTDIQGPYILVGHSMGGIYTRVFTKRNINEVKGLIQIDPSVEEQARLSEGNVPFLVKLQSLLLDIAFRIGIPRIIMNTYPSLVGFDKNMTKTEKAFASTLLKNKNKNMEGERLFDNMNDIKTASNFGPLPVIVLSADKSQEAMVQAYGDEVKNWHKDLAKRLSNNSNFIIVTNSDHFIQIDQPKAVIDNILGMLNQIK